MCVQTLSFGCACLNGMQCGRPSSHCTTLLSHTAPIALHLACTHLLSQGIRYCRIISTLRVLWAGREACASSSKVCCVRRADGVRKNTKTTCGAHSSHVRALRKMSVMMWLSHSRRSWCTTWGNVLGTPPDGESPLAHVCVLTRTLTLYPSGAAGCCLQQECAGMCCAVVDLASPYNH
jgi:hypothetical protein